MGGGDTHLQPRSVQQTKIAAAASKNSHTHTNASLICGKALGGTARWGEANSLQHSRSSIVTLLHSSHIIIPAAVTLQRSHVHTRSHTPSHISRL